jgi:hypothetical protein
MLSAVGKTWTPSAAFHQIPAATKTGAGRGQGVDELGKNLLRKGECVFGFKQLLKPCPPVGVLLISIGTNVSGAAGQAFF